MFSFSFTSFFIILVAALFFSLLSKRFHLPWVISLIIAGVVIGDTGFQLVTVDPVLNFFAEIGLVFLMFLAGLETKLSSIVEIRAKAFLFVLLNGLFPFFVGFCLAYYFGFGLIPSILFGTVFSSTSVAVLVPFLDAHKTVHKRCGSLLLAGTVIEDITSLLILSLLLQFTARETSLPLPLFYTSAIILVFLFRLAIPKLREYLTKSRRNTIFRSLSSSSFETELRVAIVILIGSVILFELIGFHAVVGGFMAGLILSEFFASKELFNKIHVLGYGLFVPIFFVVVGLTLQLDAVATSFRTILLVLSASILAIFVKLLGGYIAGRVEGYSRKDSSFLGWATVPRLTTSFAVAYAGLQFGLVSELFVTTVVVISVTTTFVGSLVMNALTSTRK